MDPKLVELVEKIQIPMKLVVRHGASLEWQLKRAVELVYGGRRKHLQRLNPVAGRRTRSELESSEGSDGMARTYRAECFRREDVDVKPPSGNIPAKDQASVSKEMSLGMPEGHDGQVKDKQTPQDEQAPQVERINDKKVKDERTPRDEWASLIKEVEIERAPQIVKEFEQAKDKPASRVMEAESARGKLETGGGIGGSRTAVVSAGTPQDKQPSDIEVNPESSSRELELKVDMSDVAVGMISGERLSSRVRFELEVVRIWRGYCTWVIIAGSAKCEHC